jgi:hypothetical protein
VPVAVVTSGDLAGKSVTGIVVGAGTSCVLASGAPYCWGGNYDGEIGIGTVGGRFLPTAVYTGGALAGRAITAIGGGGNSFFAITAEPAGKATAAGTFTAIAPARVLDTRTGFGGTSGPVPGQARINVQAAGWNGIPENASAVAMNLTVTDPATSGYLSVSASGAALPQTSNLNFEAGRTVPNMVISPIGADGKFSIFNGSPAAANLIADITGYFLGGTPGTPGAYQPVAPTRLLDTRIGLGAAKRAAGPLSTTDVAITGRAGVPASDVSAVVLNVTATDSSSVGYVTAFGKAAARPATSNLNYQTGGTVASLVVAPIGASGAISLYNGSAGSVQLIADVAGYFLAGTPTAAGAFVPINPTRLIDSRIGLAAPGRLEFLQSAPIPVGSPGGLPKWATASAMINLTVVNPAVAGYASARSADDSGTPRTSTVNFAAGQTVANAAVSVRPGHITSGSPGGIDIVVDTFGYFHN